MKLNLLTPLNTLGYGYVGCYLAKNLYEQGHDVSLFPIGQVQIDNLATHKIVNGLIKNAKHYDKTANSLRIYHQFSLAEHVGKAAHIGFPIFELNKFSDVEKHHIQNQDKVVVCSKWARDIILSETTQTNVDVVPLGVDQQVLLGAKTLKPSVERHSDTECVFINVGKWEIRKGHDLLIECFNKAFDVDDKVELWLMCDNPFLKPEERALWEQLALHSKMGRRGRVRLIPRVPTQMEVLAIMNQADIGVWPALAEGWNLELLEMMALGKQVIATNYSAHTEFCNADNATLIDVRTTVPAYDGKWFYGQGEWAFMHGKPTADLVDRLREGYKSGLYAETNHNGVLTGKQFSWENSARKLVQTIDF